MNNRKHYAAAVLAFVIWGFFSIPLRAIQDYSSGQILYFRILFSLLVLVLIISLFKRKDLRQEVMSFKTLSASQKNKTVFLTLAGGFILTINWLTFIYIVNHINVKTASFSYLICPVITAVLGYVVIGEKLGFLQWLAVGLCALSCLLMGLNSAPELGYSFLTAFTYALYLITQRINQGFDRIIVLGIQVFFAFLILTAISGYLVGSVPGSMHFYLIIMLIAVLFTVIPLFLNLFALNRINSATIGILMYLNPLFNFMVAFFVFRESISPLQVAGYSLIIVALLMFNYPNIKKLQGAALKS